MSVHSLLGCGIHAVHAECCPNVSANCQDSCSCENERGCERNCEQHKKATQSCHCEAVHSHKKFATAKEQKSEGNSANCSDKAVRSDKTVSHKSPMIPPCQCACNGSHCVFVVDATKPVLIDRFSLEPVNAKSSVARLQCFLLLSQFSPADLDFDASQLGAPRYALTQVWLL